MRSLRRRRAACVAPALVVALVIALAGVAEATFGAATTSPTFPAATKRIFPGSRTVFAADLRDASSGTSEANASDALAVAGDARTATTSAWSSAFSSSRYLDFDYANPLPGGLSASGVTFNFSFASSNNNTTCFYFEVRSRSTNLVLGLHGSAAAPVACTTSAYSTVSTAVSEATSSDVVNNLRVRVYESNSGNLSSSTDLATVTGSTAYGAFTLNRASLTDASSGVATTSPWSLATGGDGAVYVNANNWKGGPDAVHYFKTSFPATLPAGATVTGATFSHTFKDQDGISACFYAEVYAGTTLIATHGSALAGYCNTTSSFVTTAVSLPEVNSAAIANALSVKMYIWDGSASKRSQHDQVSVTFDYYLNS